MIVKHGNGTTEYGPGVDIELTGAEVATAIDAYLVAHGIHVSGPRTVTVNGELCESGRVYVDPSGFVIADGKKVSGRGPARAQQPPLWSGCPFCNVPRDRPHKAGCRYPDDAATERTDG
jgi:hypothetical protein